MLTIEADALPYVALLLAAVGVASFLLGFEAANHDARRIQRGLQSQLNAVRKQKRELTTWVRTNWPSEYAAFNHGITEGYQQGVLQGPDLMEDDHEPA